MEEEINYAEIDQNKIMDYLFKRNGLCSVEELFAYSGANRLRIHPLLLRLKQMQLIDFVGTDKWGSPTIIRMIN